MMNDCSHDKKAKDEPVDQLEISVSSMGVQVSGKGKGMDNVEATIDRLIKKHKNFMMLKKKNNFGMSYV